MIRLQRSYTLKYAKDTLCLGYRFVLSHADRIVTMFCLSFLTGPAGSQLFT